ncbi:MAG: flagellar motor switch protein FliG [Clostridia bacterium]|nr:flagellar motor switch protein FliG [Clostridia bacterium]
MSSTLTKQQKAAAVMISLGAESASNIYKYLSQDEIEQLTIEISGLRKISSDETEDVLTGFYQMCLTQKVITEGGMEYAKNVLEKAFGAQQATVLLERVTNSLKARSFEFLRKADYKNLMAIIQNEHPQTIALVLSYATADQASTIISELSRDKQIEVVERIAKMESASPEVIKLVEQNLETKFASIVSVDFTEIGGINYIADVMNHMDRSNEKYIFDELTKKDEGLSDEIRKRMFVFEDITILDDMSIQRFLRDVDGKDLVLAIKGSNQEVSNLIFKNMSQRQAETIKSDLEFAHNVRLRDVEEAQQRIVAIIRRLEEEGEVIIIKGGKDEVIA